MVDHAPRADSSRLVLVPPELPSGLRRPMQRCQRLAGHTMGTTWRVTCYGDRDGDEIVVAIEGVLQAIIDEMSTWVATSSISRFNDAAAGSWHAVPDRFWRVLTMATDVAQRSGGAFDPTIGPMTDLWGFGSAGAITRRPDDHVVCAQHQRVGWQAIAIDEEAQRIRQPGGLQLDLSAIAKGFAVDEVACALEDLGIVSYLCEIGGELRGAGCKADGSPWWVQLEGPPGCTAGPDIVLALCGKAVATSGDWVRNFDDRGVRYGHTIDPRSGNPLNHPLLAVTVVAESCMAADALATAILVLGPEVGFEFAERADIAARLVIEDAGAFRSKLTSRLECYT